MCTSPVNSTISLFYGRPQANKCTVACSLNIQYLTRMNIKPRDTNKIIIEFLLPLIICTIKCFTSPKSIVPATHFPTNTCLTLATLKQQRIFYSEMGEGKRINLHNLLEWQSTWFLVMVDEAGNHFLQRSTWIPSHQESAKWRNTSLVVNNDKVRYGLKAVIQLHCTTCWRANFKKKPLKEDSNTMATSMKETSFYYT